MILCFIAFAVLIILRNYIYNFFARLITWVNIGFDVEEGLPNYFSTLTARQKEWSIKEEENIRGMYKEELNFKILQDETLERLKTAKEEGER